MDELSLLMSTRARLADRKRWTTNAFARNELGEPTLPSASDACQWCLAGSLLLDGSDPRFDTPTLVRHAGGYNKLIKFNDDRGHEAVISLLDEVIIELRGWKPIPF